MPGRLCWRMTSHAPPVVASCCGSRISTRAAAALLSPRQSSKISPGLASHTTARHSFKPPAALRTNPGERFAIVLPLMLAFAFFSNLTYALVGALLKDWLEGPNGSGGRLTWFNRAMGLVLVLTAFWMATI